GLGPLRLRSPVDSAGFSGCEHRSACTKVTHFGWISPIVGIYNSKASIGIYRRTAKAPTKKFSLNPCGPVPVLAVQYALREPVLPGDAGPRVDIREQQHVHIPGRLRLQ